MTWFQIRDTRKGGGAELRVISHLQLPSNLIHLLWNEVMDEAPIPLTFNYELVLIAQEARNQ